MARTVIIQVIRFILFVLVQVMILNYVEPGWGIYPMLYPLFIMMLPFELGVVAVMVVAFFTGLTIDSLSNGFGLHASAATVMAYARPWIFKVFQPRDGYEPDAQPSIYGMGTSWFIYVFGILLLIHHSWYFVLEHFKMNEWLLVLRTIGLNTVISFALSILVQVIFVSRRRSER